MTDTSVVKKDPILFTGTLSNTRQQELALNINKHYLHLQYYLLILYLIQFI